jgi:hypothetical protein
VILGWPEPQRHPGPHFTEATNQCRATTALTSVALSEGQYTALLSNLDLPHRIPCPIRLSFCTSVPLPSRSQHSAPEADSIGCFRRCQSRPSSGDIVAQHEQCLISSIATPQLGVFELLYPSRTFHQYGQAIFQDTLNNLCHERLVLKNDKDENTD